MEFIHPLSRQKEPFLKKGLFLFFLSGAFHIILIGLQGFLYSDILLFRKDFVTSFLETRSQMERIDEKLIQSKTVLKFLLENVKKGSLPAPVPLENVSTDMEIGEVVTDSVNLRTGPGLNNSPLMTVSKGVTLLIEVTEGNWYRVVAPTGERGWVSKEYLSLKS